MLTFVAALTPLLLAGGAFVGQLGVRNAVLATDFRAYYTAGRMVLGGVRSDFYSPATQFLWQQSWAPEMLDPAQLNPFRNPPFVAALFAPFSLIPPELGFLLWSVLNLGLLAVILQLAQRALAESGPTAPRRAVLLTVSFLPVVVTLLLGQLSLFLVLGVFGAWAAFRAGHEVRGGLALGLLLLRPQFLVLPVLLLLLQRRWRALIALAGAGFAVFAVSLALVGWDGLLTYSQLLTGTLNWQDSFSISPQRMHTWRGFLQLLLHTDDPAPVQLPWLIGVLVATSAVVRAWWGKWDPSGPRFDLQWAMLIVGAVFVSPYANFHDLSLLLVAGVLTVRAASAMRSGAAVGTAPLLLLPVLGYLSVLATQISEPLWHVQLSVVFMAGALGVLSWQAWAPAAERLTPTRDSSLLRGLEAGTHAVATK